MTIRTINYTDLDGAQATKTLMFHLNKMDRIKFLGKHPNLQKEMEEVKSLAETEDETKMASAFVKTIDIVDDIVMAGYGVREGDKFLKTRDIVNEFIDSEVHDEFVYQLLTDTNMMTQFFKELFPDLDFNATTGLTIEGGNN